MICPNCGSNIPNDSVFCMNCGQSLHAQAPAQPPASPQVPPQVNILHYYDPSGVAAKLRAALASPQFMVICILLTAAALPVNGLPVIAILFAVAAWVTYGKAKSVEPVMDTGGLKFISGIMTASFVLKWIAFGLMVLSSVRWIVMLYFVKMAENKITQAFAETDLAGLFSYVVSDMFGVEMMPMIEEFLESYIAVIEIVHNNLNAFLVIAAVVLVLSTVALGVFNGVFYARFRKLASRMAEAYISSNAGKLCFKGVSAMLMITGVVRLLFDLVNFIVGDTFVGLFSGCLSVAFIVASMWVKGLQAELQKSASSVENRQPSANE